jgi:hypothetical protein
MIILSKIPIVAKVITIDVPPELIRGSGIPVTGIIPIFIPILIKIWKNSIAQIPVARYIPK